MNYVCNILAKSTISQSLQVPPPPHGCQLLPLKSAAIYVNDENLTTDVSKEVHFSLGGGEAREFYTQPKP